jgi:hypothetical protein
MVEIELSSFKEEREGRRGREVGVLFLFLFLGRQ